jgi:RNA recognition motif-containing protein
MQTKLYVTNLSRLATSSSVRQFFGACGDVVEVEFLAERSLRPVSAAYVTMATGAGAALAVSKLHGTLLHDRSLMISVASGQKEGPSAQRAKAGPVGFVITQQYRDRHGMSYELECAGRRLTVRFLFPEEDPAWRAQVHLGSGTDPVEATAATRELAFNAVVAAWRPLANLPAADVPWAEVIAALKSVRAI